VWWLLEIGEIMTEEMPEFGPVSVDNSIKTLELKLETLKRVKGLCETLNEKATITVHNPHDSHNIEITVKADEPLDEIQELAGLDRMLQGESFNPDSIEYDYEEEQYKLSTVFKPRR